jgi:hypothetical protein
MEKKRKFMEDTGRAGPPRQEEPYDGKEISRIS